MKYFVQDPKTNQFYYTENVPDMVRFLERLTKERLGLTRAQFTQNLADLGHGYDDPQGITFTRALAADHFYIGAVKSGGQHFRCDIHDTNNFSKPEFGD
jgi:hypothetical protein